MMVACAISEKINNFSNEETEKIRSLLSRYQLPVAFNIDKANTWNILVHDKKKSGSNISFVVLDKIGKASLKKISLTDLQQLFYSL
jgi:3-dehydroquinate synthetase